MRLGRPDHQRPARPPVDAAGHHRPRVRGPDQGGRVGRPRPRRSGAGSSCDPDPKCGACDSCRAGRPANCTNIVALGVYRDGALAQYVTAPANSVYPISEDVPAELAALVEPLACVVNGTNRAALRPGEIGRRLRSGRDRLPVHGGLPCRRRRPDHRRRAEPGARPGRPGASAPTSCSRPTSGPSQRAELMPAGADVVVDAVGAVLPQAIEAAGHGRPGDHLRHEPERPPGRSTRSRSSRRASRSWARTSRTSRSRPRSGWSRAAS